MPTLEKMYIASGQDIRQTLNNLQVWTTTDKKLTFTNVKQKLSGAQKDFTRTMWDVVPHYFNPNSSATLREKIDWYFVDMGIVPLMVEDNLLRVSNSPPLDKLSEAVSTFSKSLFSVLKA